MVDALTHSGPAAATRIDRTVCTKASNPYEPVSDIPTYSARLVDAIFVNRLNQEPKTSNEPPLKCYVTLNCPVAGSARVASVSAGGATRFADTAPWAVGGAGRPDRLPRDVRLSS